MLFLQTKLLDKRVVVALVISFEVAQVRAAISHHLEQTAARMEVLRILLEVLGELVNLLGKERDLHIGRAGVSIVSSNVLNDRRLFPRRKHR